MNQTNSQPDFFSDLQRELRQVWQGAKDGWYHSGVSLRNGVRKLRTAQIDYIVMTLGGPMPERDEPPRGFIERQFPLPPPSLSIEILNERLRLVADADNVKGVLFLVRGFDTGLASLQNIRQSILRLRAAGKTAVVYTPDLSLASYFVATAANRIILPPSAMFAVLGMRSEAIFLKDAMARMGLHMDAIQISPYKTGPNMFVQSGITPEQEEQITWLLDEMMEMVIEGMADGRQMTPATLRQHIDKAPFFAQEALEAGLIDNIAYEDELAFILGAELATDEEGEGSDTAVTKSKDKKPAANLQEWRDAYNLLLEKPHRHTAQFIGVITLNGIISMGASQRPPIHLPLPLLGEETSGEATFLSLLRRAEKMNQMAALILHVDSPGGDALASDLIAREISRLNVKKPVIIYMGNVAASGGYYVSATSRHIMSQNLTITGSIGVYMLRLSTSGLFDKLGINQTGIERGKHAGLYSRPTPLVEEERQILWDGISESYRQFKEVVAHGRDLPFEQLDPICEGRVWSGRQAITHKLVDSHGDFLDAVQKAAELAGLATDGSHEVRVVNLYPKSNRHLIPKPYETVEEIAQWLSGEKLREWSGRPLYLLPFDLHIR